MIYIENKANNTITTDSVIETLPTSLLVYLDDILIGTLVNESTKNEYFVFTIPAIELINNNIQNKEYQMKIINADNATLIKTELVMVKDSSIIQSIQVTNNKNEIFYE